MAGSLPTSYCYVVLYVCNVMYHAMCSKYEGQVDACMHMHAYISNFGFEFEFFLKVMYMRIELAVLAL